MAIEKLDVISPAACENLSLGAATPYLRRSATHKPFTSCISSLPQTLLTWRPSSPHVLSVRRLLISEELSRMLGVLPLLAVQCRHTFVLAPSAR